MFYPCPMAGRCIDDWKHGLDNVNIWFCNNCFFLFEVVKTDICKAQM